MKKVCKIIGRVFLFLLIALLLFTLVTFIIDRVKTKQETERLKELGYYHPVSVGDHSLNVCEFGNPVGKHTVVALAGLGMGDFSVAERQMTAAIEQDYRVVFVDRAGYGFSDDTKQDMTVDFIVEDYRKALQAAGIEGPYILMPHSIGGVYANWWYTAYPDEIEGVVFVDGSQLSEHAFDDDDRDGTVSFGDRALAVLAKLGFGRYVLRTYEYHLPDQYTEEEQYLCDALSVMTSKSFATLSEDALVVQNGTAAWNRISPNDIPKLYICASFGIETKDDLITLNKWINRQIEINDFKHMPIRPTEFADDDPQLALILQSMENARQEILYPYAEKMGNCEVVLLPGDHMIYEMRPEECGTLVKAFIDSLN